MHEQIVEIRLPEAFGQNTSMNKENLKWYR